MAKENPENLGSYFGEVEISRIVLEASYRQGRITRETYDRRLKSLNTILGELEKLRHEFNQQKNK